MELRSQYKLVIRLFSSHKSNPVKRKSVADESKLPEFIYAGKNVKPHTRIYVMGNALHGALGVERFLRPTNKKRVCKYMHRPHRLAFADELKVHDVACGYGFTIFSMQQKHEIPFYGTGTASNCQIGYHCVREGHPLEVVIDPTIIRIPLSKNSTRRKVSCGRSHSIVWTDTDGLWTFGNNAFGQCGRPILKDEDYTMNVNYYKLSNFNGKSIEQIECGQDTSFVLSDGVVYSCGWSADGQTGHGTYSNVHSFQPVEGALKGEKVIKISSKADCILALTDKGDVFGWGNSEYRQFESVTSEQQINTPTKLNLKLQDAVVDVAASGTCCYVLTDAGDVWSWGYGILGTGPTVTCSSTPKCIPSTLLGRNILNPDSKVTKIFAGVSDAAAVDNKGGLFVWGRNATGCLGLGHTSFQSFPLRVCMASFVDRVSIGVDHMAVVATSLM